MRLRSFFQACLIQTVFIVVGCNVTQPRIGMSLLFLNFSSHPIGVAIFNPDGHRGPTPGFLGRDSDELLDGKHMGFMPGDTSRPIPSFVDVAWVIATPEIEIARARRDAQFEDYSPNWMKETEAINARQPRKEQRVDLTPILTPELIAFVRKNTATTNLKLTIIFKDDQVTIKAAPEDRTKSPNTELIKKIMSDKIR